MTAPLPTRTRHAATPPPECALSAVFKNQDAVYEPESELTLRVSNLPALWPASQAAHSPREHGPLTCISDRAAFAGHPLIPSLSARRARESALIQFSHLLLPLGRADVAT